MWPTMKDLVNHGKRIVFGADIQEDVDVVFRISRDNDPTGLFNEVSKVDIHTCMSQVTDLFNLIIRTPTFLRTIGIMQCEAAGKAAPLLINRSGERSVRELLTPTLRVA